MYVAHSSEAGSFLLIRGIIFFFFCCSEPRVTGKAGMDSVLPLRPETQKCVCLNTQAQKRGLCILYRKLLLFAASRIHNVLSTGDRDVGLDKHRAAIPYITGPWGEVRVTGRNSLTSQGKIQEAMQDSWKKTRGQWGKYKPSMPIITWLTTCRKTSGDETPGQPGGLQMDTTLVGGTSPRISSELAEEAHQWHGSG